MLISERHKEANRQRLETEEGFGRVAGGYAQTVRALIHSLQPKTILDYGCGQGVLKKQLAVFDIAEYDPAVEGKTEPPDPADLVICADVLQHVEPWHVDDVLEDLRRVSLKWLFITIRCSGKGLSVEQPMEWWLPKLWNKWRIRHVEAADDQFSVMLKARMDA